MPSPDLLILVPLLAAHFISDFPLQSDGLIRRKRSVPGFTSHILLTGAVAYLLLGQWTHWQIPVVLMLAHAGIDYCKLSLTPKWLPDHQAFIADQLAHVASIVAIASIGELIPRSMPWWATNDIAATYFNTCKLAIGVVLATQASGLLIEKTLPLILDRPAPLIAPRQGLPRAGRYIGYFERLLLFILILNNQFGAAGFLVAAKSIFRFGELKDGHRSDTEYILIGTLYSFTLGILVPLLVRSL